ncbi:MAG: hypothetical protein V3V62_00780 [bacterium]
MTGKRIHRAARFGRAALAALALAIILPACAAELESKMKRPRPVVTLRAIPRHLQVAPHEEFVWLWDRPGGAYNRAVRQMKVRSGARGTVLEWELPSGRSALWDRLKLRNNNRQPVRWVKVQTKAGEGWVRIEFIEPR